MNATKAADILGINRRQGGDLRPMVQALSMHSWRNTQEEASRYEAGAWALTHWQEYQEECNRRRKPDSDSQNLADESAAARRDREYAREQLMHSINKLRAAPEDLDQG